MKIKLKLNILLFLLPLIFLSGCSPAEKNQSLTTEIIPPNLAASTPILAPDATLTTKNISPDLAASTPILAPETTLENCDSYFINSTEIESKDFFIGIKNKVNEIYQNNNTYSYVSSDGSIAKNGPFSTWVYEMLLENSKEVKPKEFDEIKFGDVKITWEEYLEFKNNLCETYQNQKSNGTLRNLIINITDLVNYRDDWPGHASKWLPFPYVETGSKVIVSPSPKGLEFYTKYITGGGVIIVSGTDIPDEALLQARKSVVYMTSKRSDISKILKDNQVRISLFGAGLDSSSLPEYKGTDEEGGFAMGMTDTSMTANADWLCRPGNYDIGGDPVIHELAHTINHVVFEETNEHYFYERIFKIAEHSIKNGIFDTGFKQNLEENQTQNMSNYMGEFWAMTVEGYMMDKKDFKNPPYDTRDSIKKVDPKLYDLITRYFPTDPWEFCK